MMPTFRQRDPTDEQFAGEISGLLVPSLGETDDLITRQRALDLMRSSSTVVGAVDEHLVVALCVELLAPGQGRLAAIAVGSDQRGRGYGRAAVEWAVNRLSLDVLTAETDIDAVGFYRRSGWTVTDLGEKYPGVERFQCRWERRAQLDGDDLT